VQKGLTLASRRANPLPPYERAGLLAGVLRDARLVWRLLGDPRLSLLMKAFVPGLALLYVLSPVDLIPGFLFPIVGQMDDLAIVALAVKLFIQMAPPQVVAEHRAAMSRESDPNYHSRSDETVDAEYRVVE
jgi:uncharacterized membrane protein YkvA (DUF1232 family)